MKLLQTEIQELKQKDERKEGREMGELFDKLANYGNSGIYPFHMPGHKKTENG